MFIESSAFGQLNKNFPAQKEKLNTFRKQISNTVTELILGADWRKGSQTKEVSISEPERLTELYAAADVRDIESRSFALLQAIAKLSTKI